MINSARVVVSLDEVNYDDKHSVGEHAANIGSLKSINITTSQGFVITPQAYFNFIAHNNLETKISNLLGSIDERSESSKAQVSKHIKNLITHAEIPDDLLAEIFAMYEKYGAGAVSVHTSIISGDEQQNSFPRVYSFEQIEGEAALLEILREFWASVFDLSLINYRTEKGINHLKTGIVATVIKTPQQEASGRIYTIDMHGQDKSKMVVETDGHNSHLVIDKKNKSVSKRRPHDKPVIYIKDGSHFDMQFEGDLNELIKFAADIEDYFYFPQEITWIQNKGKYHVLSVKPIGFYGNN